MFTSRRLAALLLLAVALAAPSAVAKNPPALSAEEVRGRVKASVCYVSGKSGHGSGFVAAKGVVATNAHVVCDELVGDVTVSFIDDAGKTTKHKVELLTFDAGRDLALFKVADLPADRPPLPLNPKPDIAKKGRAYVVGNPAQQVDGMSLINSVGEATVADTLTMWRDKPYFELTGERLKATDGREANGWEKRAAAANRLLAAQYDRTAIGPGNSGGPVLDDRGRVIGVLTGAVIERRTGTPLGKFYAIPAEDVQDALDRLGKEDTWAAKGKVAVARHDADMAMRSLYADLLVAETMLDIRKDVWGLVVLNNLLFAWQFVGVQKAEDKQVMAAFKKADEALRKAAARTQKAAKSDLLPAAQRQQMTDAVKLLDEVRKVVTKPDVKPAHLKMCEKDIASGREAFRKYATSMGWSETDVRDQWLRALTDAGVELKVKE